MEYVGMVLIEVPFLCSRQGIGPSFPSHHRSLGFLEFLTVHRKLKQDGHDFLKISLYTNQKWISKVWLQNIRFCQKNKSNILYKFILLEFIFSIIVVVSQLLSTVWLFAWTVPCQASLSFTVSWRLLKLMSIEPVMDSTILSSVIPISSCTQALQASGSFPVIRLFASGDQSVEAWASASVLPVILEVDFLLDWLVWSPWSPRDSQESSPTLQF